MNRSASHVFGESVGIQMEKYNRRNGCKPKSIHLCNERGPVVTMRPSLSININSQQRTVG
jgi:hypothetical protein